MNLPDEQARERALDTTRSFIVQAPAGAGKTELLMQRYLALLARVRRPESILAITFTRKAAGEMRRRVLEALERAAGPRPDKPHEQRTWELAVKVRERDKQLGWQVAAYPHRLQIRTIDSFCAALVRRMPWLSRLGAPPEIVEDPDRIYRAAARTTVQLVESPDHGRPIARLLLHLDNDTAALERMLADMLARRDQWLRHLHAERASLEASLQAVLRLYEHRHTDLPDLPDRLQDEQWEIIAAIFQALKLAVARLRLEFQSRRQADYIEVALGALQALGSESEPTDLMLALDCRLEHILMDEFQDTSLTQFRLLELLTAGWSEGDGRTLFLVGDPMQSIYRFREAEVGLFLKAAREGLGPVRLEPLSLTVNFRSNKTLVEWFNQVFPLVLPPTDDIATGAVRFSPSQPRPDAPEPAAVVVHPLIGKNTWDEEAALVARTVRQIQERDPQASVAVLVRARTHLPAILRALREAGLPYRAVEIESLADVPVVQDLLALTRALLHLADRVAWLALLRGPWCGLTLAELESLFAADHESTVWEIIPDPARTASLSPDTRTRLDRLRAVLQTCFEHRRRSLREWVESAWLALGGPACIRQPADLDNAEAYFQLLEALDDGGGLSLDQLKQRLDSLWALPDPDAPQHLQVMTIHKAKGLEFDAVIVPALGRRPRYEPTPLLNWVELPRENAGSHLLVAPPPGKTARNDPLGELVKFLIRQKDEHETGRLLYVAATRARRELHLIGHAWLSKTKSGVQLKVEKRSLLNHLWPAVEAIFQSAAAKVTPRQEVAVPAPPRLELRRLPADWRRPEPPPGLGLTLEPLPDEPEAAEKPVSYLWVGQTLRHVGTVVHGMLHRIGRDGLEHWDRTAVAALRHLYVTRLRELGVPDDELDGAVAKVERALIAALEDPRGRWILSSTHAEAENELDLTGWVNGRLRRVRLDRTFVDASGIRWIIDYKTGVHEGGSPEQFLDNELERYRPQLEIYAALMQRIDSRPIRLGLYFPLMQGWREFGAPVRRAAP